MIIVPIKENEPIDKALKKFKKKIERTGLIRELRERQAFIKPSIARRQQIIRAVYKNHLVKSACSKNKRIKYFVKSALLAIPDSIFGRVNKADFFMPMESFLRYIQYEKRFSPHTLTAYENDLRQFFDYLETTYGALALTDITHLLVRSWLASLMEQGITARSVNRKATTLRILFQVPDPGMVIIPFSPMLKVQMPKAAKRLPVVCTKRKNGLYA